MSLAPGKHPLLLVEARVQRHMGTMQGLLTAGTVSHCRCGFLFEPDIDEYNEQRSSKTNATQLWLLPLSAHTQQKLNTYIEYYKIK